MNATEAKEWFNKNYHTPIDSFIGKYGIPELLGVYEDGEEHWHDIPIEEVLLKFAEHYHKAKLAEDMPSDEEIDKEAQYRQIEGAHPDSWEGACYWLKQKLTKSE